MPIKTQFTKITSLNIVPQIGILLIQTSSQEYLASQADSSLKPREKVENLASTYSVREFSSVIPMQA